jgi:ribosomal protein S18 acetylase RimI-like enzyme
MQPEIIFAPADKADVDQLAALEIDLFHTDRCSKKNLRYLIKHSHVIVAKQPGADNILGYAVLLSRKNSKKMRIYSFGVVAAVRNQGLAGRLLEQLERIVKKAQHRMLTLEVSDGNTAAISLYKKHGFEQYGFRLGYYEDGGHAILMRKHIPEESCDHDHPLHQGCLY